MKYVVPRLSPDPAAAAWIADNDGHRVMRIETVAYGRSFAVILYDPDGDLLATIHPHRKLTRTIAQIEIPGELSAALSLHRGAVEVHTGIGDYDIAGDFAAWDFHILLNASPVADVTRRPTDQATYLVEASDNEEQLPLLAMILAVDLLTQTAN